MNVIILTIEMCSVEWQGARIWLSALFRRHCAGMKLSIAHIMLCVIGHRTLCVIGHRTLCDIGHRTLCVSGHRTFSRVIIAK